MRRYAKAAFCILLVLTLLSACLQTAHYPAPTELESMDVYQFLSEAVGKVENTEDAINAFTTMCDMPVECLDDLILVEAIYYEDSKTYLVGLVRQFEFSDSTEFVQLHLELYYSINTADQINSYASWHGTDETNISQILNRSGILMPAEGKLPTDIRVFITWTW